MARLDGTIERLFKQPAQEILLETGSGIILVANGAQLPVVKTALTTQQILGAVSEILPAELRTGFPKPGSSNFPYSSPFGTVMVKLDLTPDKVRVNITPHLQARPAAIDLPPDDGKIELATPADMMGLASQAHGGPAGNGAPGRRPTPPSPGIVPSPYHAALETKPAPAPAAASASVAIPPKGDSAGRMQALLETMLEKKASDLHLSSQNPPMLRLDGDMTTIPGWDPLSSEELKGMLWAIAPERNKEQWEQTKDTDFAHELPQARFRVNVFMDRKGIGAVLRQIPSKILTVEEMGLSKHILDLCHLSKGLVLVTGPTGSGKSTTLAAMIDYINRNREDHIITIEDPIEFVHPNKKCLVNQREVGVHTGSFKNALRAALREDPDIVLVGEMRDLETIAIAIETAETGHLVFGTLHTNTAPSTVDRIIDQFPSDRQEQIRLMLSESLKGVITQVLVKKIGGGRAPAQEVLIGTSSVSNLIREGKTFQLPSIMQTGKNVGMVSMNDALLDLVKRKLCEPKDAYAKAIAKAELKQQLERAGFSVDEPAAG